jgi:protoheme IX farnesyltransferase
MLAMSGIVFYILVYTHWLKRSSTQNIVIGGAAGAIPALVGWAAVTGTLSWVAWLIFAIVFVWTPPHFWALALMIRDDYAKVGIPMLPVVAGNEVTVRQIWFYTLILVPTTLLLVYPLHATGIVYAAIALALGGLFILKAWRLLHNPDDRTLAKDLFLYSISYMMLLCLSMVIDSLSLTHRVINVLASQLHLIS